MCKCWICINIHFFLYYYVFHVFNIFKRLKEVKSLGSEEGRIGSSRRSLISRETLNCHPRPSAFLFASSSSTLNFYISHNMDIHIGMNQALLFVRMRMRIRRRRRGRTIIYLLFNSFEGTI
jgi:hypothetical protein